MAINWGLSKFGLNDLFVGVYSAQDCRGLPGSFAGEHLGELIVFVSVNMQNCSVVGVCI